MEDHRLALTYLPHFYADEREPFPIHHIGYQILREDGRSPSFNRTVRMSGAAFVIEYAVFWDYDIQHMYDLEHVWVSVGRDGAVINAEGSAHGHYLNCFLLQRRVEEGTHIPVYLQPGKHAILADLQLSKLFSGYLSACDAEAGGGLLIPNIAPIAERLHTSPETDAMIREHIRRHYRFAPTLRTERCSVEEAQLMPLDQLLLYIPRRIGELIARLRAEDME